MMCPTGVYIPQLVGEDLLEELDMSRIPNFANLDPAYTNQAWDPGNKYAICKNWGWTGWIYDTTIVTTEIKTWADFIDVAMGEASGKTRSSTRPPTCAACTSGPTASTGPPRIRPSWMRARTSSSTSSPSTSRRSTRIPASTSRRAATRLSQVWNGDARQGLIVDRGGRRRPRPVQWAPRRPRDRAVDGQLVHPRGGRERRCRLQLHQLHPRPGESAQGHRVPRLQHRRQGSARRCPPTRRSWTWCTSPTRKSAACAAGLARQPGRVVEIYNKVKAAAGA